MGRRQLILFDVDDVLIESAQPRRLPGTAEALARLRHTGSAVLSLVTPDDQTAARARTTEVGLERYLDFSVGCYGDDRPSGIAAARDRARDSYGAEFSVLVVTSAGADDLAALRPAADVVVAVAATGGTEPTRPAGADHVVTSLMDVVALTTNGAG